MRPQRLFISHATQDRPLAAEMHAQLFDAGQQPWMEETVSGSLPPPVERDEAIRQSDALLLLLSPFALESAAVRLEWQTARSHHKPVLLLLVQRVSPLELLAALEPCLPGPNPPPDAEILDWIDVRANPLEASVHALEWLKDRSVAQHDLPPTPYKLSHFHEETLPLFARLTGWIQILLAGLGAPVVLACLRYLAHLQTRPGVLLFLDQFLLALLAGASALGMVQLGRLGWNGVQTFRRRCRHPGELFRPLSLLSGLVGLLLMGLGAASTMLGKTALLHGALYPARAIGFGLFAISLGAMYTLPALLAGYSRRLHAWMPGPEKIPGRGRVQRSSAAARKSSALPSSDAADPKNGNGHSRSQVRPPASQDPSNGGSNYALGVQALHRLRLAFAPTSGQPSPDLSLNRLGLIQTLQEKPATRQVSILFAPQDAPFGRSLERYLVKNGLYIQDDLQVTVQAHVNARINLNSTRAGMDGSLILVLSPWTKKTEPLSESIESAQAAGMSILPVLLEDTTIPREYSQFRWIDARRDLPAARRQILEAVTSEAVAFQGSQSTTRQPVVLPANARGAQAPLAIPRNVQIAQWGLYFSSTLKLFVLSILLPMALWIAPVLKPIEWLSAGLLLVVTTLQLLVVMLFFLRRLSLPWLLLIQGDCLLAGLASFPLLTSDIFWPVSTLARLALFFPVWEAVVLAWLFFVPDIRHWALGGFWLRLQNFRLSMGQALNFLVPGFIAVVFLFPAFFNRSASQPRIIPGLLEAGETSLVRVVSESPTQPWTFKGAQGDVVTIRVDGGFNTFQLQFFLSNRSRFFAQSKSTLGSASISSFRLPEEGIYEIHMADLPRRGLFRLSLSLQHPPVQLLECGMDRLENMASARLKGWTFYARQGDTLYLRMDAQAGTLDPWMSLYGPTGNLVASDDDGGRLFNARIESFYVSETGAYTLLTGSQPGTSGSFHLSLDCSS